MEVLKMKSIASYLILTLTLVVCTSIAAMADPILLSYGDSDYVGYIEDGIPASDSWERLYIDTLRAVPINTSLVIGDEKYYRSGNDFAPDGLPDVDEVAPFEQPYYKFDNVFTVLFNEAGSAYILGKYDGPNAGDLVWFVNDIAAGNTYQLPSAWGPGSKAYGISHLSVILYTEEPGPGPTPIPEPTALVLIGFGLAGLAAIKLRRRM